MKRITALILAAIMALLMFASCGQTGSSDVTTTEKSATTTPVPDTTTATVPDDDTTPTADDTTKAPDDETTPSVSDTTDTSSAPADDTTTEAPIVPDVPDVKVEQIEYTYAGSALWFEISSDKVNCKKGDTVNLTIKIINKTAIDQTGLNVAISTPDGILAGIDSIFSVDLISANGYVEKVIELTVDDKASAIARVPSEVIDTEKTCTEYNYVYRVAVGEVIKDIKIDAKIAVTARRTLTGYINIGTPKVKGSILNIDDIKIVSNSNGAVIYENNFETADDMNRGLDYVVYNNFQAGISDPTDAWNLKEENGNHYISADTPSTAYGYSVSFGPENLSDYTLTFKFRDGDHGGELVFPRVGVYQMRESGDNGVVLAGYQWVVGGWSNAKTIIQQYRMKEDGSNSERPNIGDPEYFTFSYTDWMELKMVVGADRIDCYCDGVLCVSYINIEK